MRKKFALSNSKKINEAVPSYNITSMGEIKPEQITVTHSGGQSCYVPPKQLVTGAKKGSFNSRSIRFLLNFKLAPRDQN
jgi:hypothetical protein